MTIYLANITKGTYDSTITVECEAFTTLEKAEAFMVANGMTKTSYGWLNELNFDYDGSVTELKVR